MKGFIGKLEYIQFINGDSDGVFDPTALSQALAMWLDAQTLESITKDGSDLVAAVASRSSALSAAQATDVNKPKYVASAINGKPAIQGRHDGSTASQLRVADNASLDYTHYTEFMVVQRVADVGASEHLAGKYTTSGDQREHRLYVASGAPDEWGLVQSLNGTSSNLAEVRSPEGIALDIPVLLVARYDGTRIYMTANGVDATGVATDIAAAFNGTAPLEYFARESLVDPAAVYIGEHRFYTGLLTHAEITASIADLNERWGLEVPAPDPFDTPFLFGVNLAGAEGGTVPGTMGEDYIYPSEALVDYHVGQGANCIRLPFRWERIQKTLGGALDTAEQSALEGIARYITASGAKCIFDVHNYARYRLSGTTYLIGTAEVTQSHYEDLWTRLANVFKDDVDMIFCLMNEPHGLDASEWAGYAQAAATAIRGTGATNLIHVPGVSFTNALNWFTSGNPEAFSSFSDTNWCFDMHQYLDSGNSGTADDVASVNTGVERISSVISWAKAEGYKIHFGEFNGGDNDDGLSSIPVQALRNMVTYMLDNRSVCVGGSPWAGGPWWVDDYLNLLDPREGSGDRIRLTEMQALVTAHNNIIS